MNQIPSSLSPSSPSGEALCLRHEDLLRAIRGNDLETVKKCLKKGLFHLPPYHGFRCPLALACSLRPCSDEIVKALLDAGCPASGIGAFPPPLTLALSGNHEEVNIRVIECLIQAGVDMDAIADYDYEESASGYHPMDPPGPGGPLWEYALRTGRDDVVRTLFKSPSASREAPGKTIDLNVFETIFFLLGEAAGHASSPVKEYSPPWPTTEQLDNIIHMFTSQGLFPEQFMSKQALRRDKGFREKALRGFACWQSRQMEKQLQPLDNDTSIGFMRPSKRCRL